MYRRQRQFTKSREELDAIAVGRAAQAVRQVFAVLEKSGHMPYVSLEGAAGASGLLAIALNAYKEALVDVEMEHAISQADDVGQYPFAYVPPGAESWPVPDPEVLEQARARIARLRPVPSVHSSRTVLQHRQHEDGTMCTCELDCNCHPPTRDEDPIVTGERGSWHLDTCPVSPKNRGARP